jgi:hypothetical protein
MAFISPDISINLNSGSLGSGIKIPPLGRTYWIELMATFDSSFSSDTSGYVFVKLININSNSLDQSANLAFGSSPQVKNGKSYISLYSANQLMYNTLIATAAWYDPSAGKYDSCGGVTYSTLSSAFGSPKIFSGGNDGGINTTFSINLHELG